MTGEPLYPAIVWQDRRTATWIEELEEDIQYMIRQKTGLHADAYFGATKIKWILDNVEGAKEAAMEGRLLAGPTDSWFIWNLTDRKVFATDYSTASRTALFNIHTNDGITNCWSFWKFRRAFFRISETAQKNMDMPHCGGVTEKKERS